VVLAAVAQAVDMKLLVATTVQLIPVVVVVVLGAGLDNYVV
jgi:hypothetical protein